MAIKYVDRMKNYTNPNIMVLFADTKEEVDEAEEIVVMVNGVERKPESASICYTPKLEVGVLDSEGTWNWGDEEEVGE